MSNLMKFVRFIFVVALAAAIGITIKECRSGGVNLNNNPPAPPACVTDGSGARDCPLRSHSPN